MESHMSQRTIVVGYTPTIQGMAAVRAAIEEAGRRGGTLHVVNASAGDSYVDPGLAGPAQVADLERLLTEWAVPHLFDQPVGRTDPAEEVLDAADRSAAELIVIGLRRRTPVGKLLMGSTAQRILLHATCPVLAVKA